MEFEKVLRNRASVRKYNGRMPDDETIQKVIDAALLSPIVRWHKFHLSVVTDKEVIQLAEDAANEYAKTKEPRKFMYGAPVWIILSGERHTDNDPVTEKMKNDNLFWNVGSIIENMELEAVSLGLASCGMNATIVAVREKPEVKKALEVPEGYDVLASVLIGYTDDEPNERQVNYGLIPVSYVK
ncbi:MAG: nitroreductase family protein [Lachnospiraceae bacterium]|nr:nitroreductase family protein [Lachnospiraceae bacterium]